MNQEERTRWFESLFATYGDAIFRHIAYRLGDRERAKELTQEVFMRTWQHSCLGKEIKYEKAFLYTIARNLFINEIRTDRNTTSLEEVHDLSGYEPSATGTNPEAHSEHQELLQNIAKLKTAYKEVLELRYMEGLSIKEIALLLEENETAISMRCTRALAALTDLYNQEETL